MSHNSPRYTPRLHLIARRWWARKARLLRNAGNLPASQGALDLALAHNRTAHNLTA